MLLRIVRLHFIQNNLSLFCLLRLISASADRIGYITNFSSIIELLHDIKNSSFNIEGFRHLITSQRG